MTETITRDGAVLPVKVRTARTRHVCNDCPEPIEPGDLYELAVYPPHSVQEWDSDRWLTWRNHYPRHDGHNFLIGCAIAAAYREKAEREQLEASRTVPAAALRTIERAVAERHGYSRPYAAPHLLGKCPGSAEYGHGMTLTTFHALGCCQRWDELIAQAVREQLGEGER